MKLDVKRLQGRELSGDAADQPTSLGDTCSDDGRGYGRPIAAALLVTGGALAAVSWTAFLAFLAFCAAVVALMLYVANWGLDNSPW